MVCSDLFGLEVYSILSDINRRHKEDNSLQPYHVMGYICDNDCPFGDCYDGLERLGSIMGWKRSGNERYVLGIKEPDKKKMATDCLLSNGCVFESVCSPWTLGNSFPIGEGSVIDAYSMKQGIQIGRFVTAIHCMLPSITIGDYSTIMRFANVTGEVGCFSYIGNHAYTHLGKKVGDHCYVADGSVVVKDVKSGTVVSGVPARRIKQGEELAK